jgi:hypothetical protein
MLSLNKILSESYNFNKINPIKQGFIRLFHNTDKENFHNILKTGLDPKLNTQSSEGEITWFTTELGEGYGGYTIYVDFPINDIQKYKVNSTEYTISFFIPPKSIHVAEVPIFYNKSGYGGLRTSKVLELISKYGEEKTLNMLNRFDIDEDNWKNFIKPYIND